MSTADSADAFQQALIRVLSLLRDQALPLSLAELTERLMIMRGRAKPLFNEERYVSLSAFLIDQDFIDYREDEDGCIEIVYIDRQQVPYEPPPFRERSYRTLRDPVIEALKFKIDWHPDPLLKPKVMVSVWHDGPYNGTKPTGFEFGRHRCSADDWCEVLYRVLVIAAEEAGDAFNDFEFIFGGRNKRFYFSRNPYWVKAQRSDNQERVVKIPGTDLYIDINLSANNVVALCDAICDYHHSPYRVRPLTVPQIKDRTRRYIS